MTPVDQVIETQTTNKDAMQDTVGQMDRHIIGEALDLSQVDTAAIFRGYGISVADATHHPRPRGGSAPGKTFLKGPIPLPWLQEAARLPGKALHVGVVLWFLSGLTRSRTVKLTRKWLRPFGIHPETGRRGLQALEHASLVTVERSGNKSPIVTLVTDDLRSAARA